MATSAKFSDDFDLLYVTLREGLAAVTREFGDHRLVDFDTTGAVLGAEFIGLDGEIDLRGLPDERRLRDILLTQAPNHIVILTNNPSDERGSTALVRGGLTFLPPGTPATVRVRATSLAADDDAGRTSGATSFITIPQE